MAVRSYVFPSRSITGSVSSELEIGHLKCRGGGGSGSGAEGWGSMDGAEE